MTQIELDRKAEIEAIELTEAELKAAILEGKIKKWFHGHNKDHWENTPVVVHPINDESMTVEVRQARI